MKNCTQRTRCSKLITVSSMRKRAHFCICYASCGASHGGFIFMLLVLLLCGWLLAIASTQNTFVGRLMPSTHTLPIADFATEWFFFSTRSSHSTYSAVQLQIITTMPPNGNPPPPPPPKPGVGS